MAAQRSFWKIAGGVMLFWLVVLFYMSTSLYQTDDDISRTQVQLAKALRDLDHLKSQNSELQALADSLRAIKKAAGEGQQSNLAELRNQLQKANKKFESFSAIKDIIVGEAHEDTEVMRRQVENGAVEMWYYVRSEILKLQKDFQDNESLKSRLQQMYEDTLDHHQSIMKDMYNLSLSGGMGAWRQKEFWDLDRLVQNRLHYLQNPKDCSTAKKIVCNLNKGCGYGCQLHHVVYCFIVAYATERTFVLQSKGWRYSPDGWEKFFLPLSEICTNHGGSSRRLWSSKIDDVQVVELPIVDSMYPKPPYLPQAVPKDLAPRLNRLHGRPIVWWIGQFIKYLTRPQPTLQKDIDNTMKAIGFKGPIVGVHVRRSDKVGTEAAFHSIEEYMFHVNEYFDQLEKQEHIHKRRIFLATDDANLLDETIKKYPEYEVLSNNEASRTASLGTRYTAQSLQGIVIDIHLLSRCDYLVCTFSSQVCRVAYEMMQSLHPDASTYFHSLDDSYYFGGQNGHSQVAIYPHKARHEKEMDLQEGDRIGVAGNHWDGYSMGTNQRSGKKGLFPSYKIIEKIDIADFPIYEEADKMLRGKS